MRYVMEFERAAFDHEAAIISVPVSSNLGGCWQNGSPEPSQETSKVLLYHCTRDAYVAGISRDAPARK